MGGPTMLDMKYVRANMEEVRRKLARRGGDGDLNQFISLDARRREIIVSVEEMRAVRNAASGEIARVKRAGGDASSEMERMRVLGEKVSVQESELGRLEDELQRLLLGWPNIPDETVPDGESAAENQVIRSWGVPTVFPHPVRDHVDLGVALDMLDLDRAAKISAARFACYRGVGAALERALATFMLDVHTRQHGYSEVLPPYLVNADSLVGTGNLPKFEQDLFHLDGWPLYLIPTAEVPVTNLYRDEILEGSALPINHVAWTPCFRSEAGAHGRDTRGLIRQHQFHKVELVKFVRPEESGIELERLTGHAERVLQLLQLPYRVVALCAGDLGFASAKTYDLEVWLPSQAKYVEISSCSNFKDFQARRANIRYREKGKSKPGLVHTLNGSGLAIGRTWVAILENYQQEDGSVVIPDVLRTYMKLDAIHPSR